MIITWGGIVLGFPPGKGKQSGLWHSGGLLHHPVIIDYGDDDELRFSYYDYDDDDDYHNDDVYDYEMSYDDQNLDQGNRQIAMRIVGGGGWWLVFRNNLSICFYQRYSAPTSSEHLFQSVSQSLHPAIHQWIHFSIHPSILACQPVQLTSKNGCVHPSTWPSAKEVPGMLMTNQWRNRESTSTKSTVYNLIGDVVIIMNWLRRMLMIFSGKSSCHHWHCGPGWLCCTCHFRKGS